MIRDPNEETPEGPTRNWWLWGSVALGVLIVGSLLFSGGSTPRTAATTAVSPDDNLSRNLFESAFETVDRLEQFNTGRALEQVLDRLNQWIALEQPNEPWELDPLVQSLPAEPAGLKELPELKSAGNLKFQPARYSPLLGYGEDGNHLLETNWLRNIARTARGTDSDELSRATKLFDWTVRNIQLEDWSIRKGRDFEYRPALLENLRDRKNDVAYLPCDVLLTGRGDYVHRAWILMLLARQENLDVVLLAVPDKDSPHGLRPWLPALVHKDGLYLFDTYLGLPIPGADGKPATLEQVVADPAILDSLDSPQEPYPLAHEELKHVVALVEGSPAYLTRRMAAVEGRLAGAKKVVLTASPTQVAEKLTGAAGVKEVRLWSHPYQALLDRHNATADMAKTIHAIRAPFEINYPTPRRGRNAAVQEQHPLFMDQAGGPQAADQPLEQNICSLWQGRMMHFKGIYNSEGTVDGANLQYLTVMVKDTDIDKLIDDFLRATRLPNEAMAQAFRQAMREFIPRAKQNATYWLGLIALDRGKHSAAVDYLKRAADPKLDGPWRYGANYNLARVYEEQAAQSADAQEAKELRQQAIELLEQDKSAQSLGNHLRARQLKAK